MQAQERSFPGRKLPGGGRWIHLPERTAFLPATGIRLPVTARFHPHGSDGHLKQGLSVNLSIYN